MVRPSPFHVYTAPLCKDRNTAGLASDARVEFKACTLADRSRFPSRVEVSVSADEDASGADEEEEESVPQSDNNETRSED